MLCPNPSCQKEIKEGAKFCRWCGTKLDGSPENSCQTTACSSQQDAFQSIDSLPQIDDATSGHEISEEYPLPSESTLPSISQIAQSDAFPEVKPEPEMTRAAEFCPTFAEGLPEWDLVPPNIMVTRKPKKI